MEKMSYADFRKTYKWLLSMYPGTDRIYCENIHADIGTCETVHYEKRGGKWQETARKTETFTPYFYMNTFDAIPFFRNLGGYERIELNYTKVGYLPVKVSSTSPDKTVKTVRTFKFF